MSRRIVILALVACCCLAGCGQKGPLKLPETVEPEPAEAGQTEYEQE